MLADTAIAVNPNDERYSRLIGEAAILPLVGRRLPIIADEYVDPEFGTGALKITPGHDPNDFEIGRRHGLDEVTVIGEDGRITDAAPERFRGMEVDEARAAVVAALREEGLVSGTQPVRARRAALAPLRPPHRAADLAPVVLRHGRARASRRSRRCATGACASTPSGPGRGVYLDWLENIRPWCISRQLWWGHQLPVWYRGEETYVGDRAARGRRLGARPGRARHLVLVRACGRSRRWAGRRRRPSCAPSTRPTCSPPRATSSSSGSRAW